MQVAPLLLASPPLAVAQALLPLLLVLLLALLLHASLSDAHDCGTPAPCKGQGAVVSWRELAEHAHISSQPTAAAARAATHRAAHMPASERGSAQRTCRGDGCTPITSCRPEDTLPNAWVHCRSRQHGVRVPVPTVSS